MGRGGPGRGDALAGVATITSAHAQSGGAEGRKDNNNNNSGSYIAIPKENAKFEVYYKAQHIVPEEEWASFMEWLRKPLVSTFRITGNRQSAQQFRQAMEKEYFAEIADVRMDGEPVDPPKAFAWYPDNLAWQISWPRPLLRKVPALTKLHKFLVNESEQGNITRQEAVSMIPPLMLDVQPSHKVLDMCAAPGSKTSQLIEMLHATDNPVPDGLVVANDADAKRCYLLVHQTKRLQSPCFVITNLDASVYPSLYTKNASGVTEKLLFDRVLCDVPCSGDATCRKNYTVWRRWGEFLGSTLFRLQTRILMRGLQSLALGGRLVYSTCSFNPVENEAVVACVLREFEGCLELVDMSDTLPDLKRRPGLHTWVTMDNAGHAFKNMEEVPHNFRAKFKKTMFPPSPEDAAAMHLERCMRIVPQDQDTGGFFIAVIRKLKPLSKSEIKRAATAAANAAAATAAAAAAAAAVADPSPAPAPASAPAAAGAGEEAALDDDEEEAGNAAEEAESVALAATMDGGAPTRAGQKLPAYKEDPFLFLGREDQSVLSLREYYGLSDDFPFNNLLIRSSEGRMRNIYVVSPLVRDMIENNDHKLVRIVNTGVRTFARSECSGIDCDFRICQEGLHVVFPFMRKRIAQVSRQEAYNILVSDVQRFHELEPTTAKTIQDLHDGCFVLTASAGEGHEPIQFLGWRGRNTVRCLVGKPDRTRLILLLGFPPVFFANNKKGEKGDGTKEDASAADGADAAAAAGGADDAAAAVDEDGPADVDADASAGQPQGTAEDDDGGATSSEEDA